VEILRSTTGCHTANARAHFGSRSTSACAKIPYAEVDGCGTRRLSCPAALRPRRPAPIEAQGLAEARGSSNSASTSAGDAVLSIDVHRIMAARHAIGLACNTFHHRPHSDTTCLPTGMDAVGASSPTWRCRAVAS
jgi:hypothetical protein